MTRKFFGTDGVRGRANTPPMTAEIALRLGMAAGRHFRRGDHRHVAVIAKDTRLSGYMLEPALTSGLVAMGVDVVLAGPLPTPAVAMLTRSMRADLGIMLSASHNPCHDNGIKLFGPDGFKLCDTAERTIETYMENGLEDHLAPADALGRVQRLDDARGRYIEWVKASFPRGRTLDGLKVVVDCAHGAAYKVAPTVLAELGATVIPLGVQPDGFNINQGCGSQETAMMQETVVREGADLGLALDGDADRIVMCDETGHRLDGDQIIATVAAQAQRQGTLAGDAVVTTVMSNMGLERYLETLGLRLERTRVGDRYVSERMRQTGLNIGGEQSGHIVLSDYGTTGDGMVAALQVLAELVATGRPASETCRRFEPLPQVLKNVRMDSPVAVDHPDIAAACAAAERRMNGTGRILLRPSGTEPVIRVMAEGDDRALVNAVVDDLCQVVAETARGNAA